MVHEIITLCVGQCGVQLGETVWKQYCAEHKIDANGTKEDADDTSFTTFYEETSKGEYVTRNLMVDLESSIIDNVKSGKYSQLFPSEFLLSGLEDTGNNYAVGMYTLGKDMMATGKVDDGYRKLVERSDNFQGFILNHSVGGGTGSGLGNLLLDYVGCAYRKKPIIAFEVYPSSIHSNCVTDVYNSLLSLDRVLDFTDINMVYDNEKMYEICQRDLKIAKPSYENINRLLSKHISGITSPFRFEASGDTYTDLNGFQMQLVSYPRLHTLMGGMSPIISKYDVFASIYGSIDQSPLIQQLNVPPIVNEEIAEYAGSVVNESVQNITENCYDSKNFFVKIDGFDPEEDLYMQSAVNYRGDVKEKEANDSIQWLRSNKKIRKVDYKKKAHFKLASISEPLPVLEDDDICESKRSAIMLGNNTAIGYFFRQRILKPFDRLWSKRAYLHHYVSIMSHGEIAEAKDNVLYLEQDYFDVLREQSKDNDDFDSAEIDSASAESDSSSF